MELSIESLKKHATELRDKARILKTKKAKERAWAKARELEQKAWFLLHDKCAKYALHSVKGTVLSTYPGYEHFLVDTCFGKMWLSPANDVNAKSWYAHTCCVEYTASQEVVIELAVEVNSDKLFLEIVSKHHRGGRINHEQYAKLCQRTDLAFFKYPDGHMSGLFS